MIAFLPLVLALISPSPFAPQEQGAFAELDFPGACERAAEQDKAVFIDFFTTWCGPCKKLDTDTWSDEGVQAWLLKKTVAIKLDAEEEVELARRYRIDSYPTMLFLRSNGEELGRIKGFRPPADFLTQAEDALAGVRPSERLREQLDAEGWNKPSLRDDLAGALEDEGRFEEALEHYLWCFDHGSEQDLSYSGVRASFLVNSIASLGRNYPEALEALRERRDAAQALLLEGTADFVQAATFCSINSALGAQESTLEVYLAMEGVEPKKVNGRRTNPRPVLFHQVFELLVEKQRYAEAVAGFGERGDPIAQELASYSFMASMDADMKSFALEMIVDKGALFVEAALGTGEHDEEAQAMIRRLIELSPGDETLAKLISHAMRADRGDVLRELISSIAPDEIDEERVAAIFESQAEWDAGDGPSMGAIQGAVFGYFDDDRTAKRSRELISAWGDPIVPALRRMAEEGVNSSDAWALTVSIADIDSQRSTDLLVDVLRGATRVRPQHGLSAVSTAVHSEERCGQLRGNAEFKPAVMRYAREGSWLERGQAATIMAKMGWEEAEPLLEAMLTDENVSLRKSAAEALEELTGRRVEYEVPARVTPGRALIPGLLEEARVVPITQHGYGRFTQDFDGTPRLSITAGKQLIMLEPDGTTQAAYALDHTGSDALALERNGEVACIVALVAESPFGFQAEFASGIGRDGTTCWSYHAPKSGVKGAALLYTSKGVEGILLSIGSQLLVALDADGSELCRRDGFQPTYEILTHPRLPGLLYTVFGDIDRFEVSSTAIRQRGRSLDLPLYASEAVLLPDAQGNPAFLVSGSGQDSTPTLARVDEAGSSIWSATLPGRVSGLAMVEIPDKPRLFAVSDSTGALMLIDELGTLLSEISLPDESQGGGAVYDLAMGELAPGEWAIFVKLLRGSFLYPLNLSGV